MAKKKIVTEEREKLEHLGIRTYYKKKVADAAKRISAEKGMRITNSDIVNLILKDGLERIERGELAA